VIDFVALSDFGWGNSRYAVQLAAEKVDHHLNSAKLDGLGNNAGVAYRMALSQRNYGSSASA